MKSIADYNFGWPCRKAIRVAAEADVLEVSDTDGQSIPQGLKPNSFLPLAARLKPRPFKALDEARRGNGQKVNRLPIVGARLLSELYGTPGP